MAASLVILGGGRMGEALVRGLVAGGWPAADLAVVEPRAEPRQRLQAAWPAMTVSERPVAAGGAVVAVKPGDVEGACRSLAGSGATRVLSIAAGVTLAQLEGWLEPGLGVLRAMTNTPALVGAAASALAGGRAAGEADLAWAEGVLGAVGRVVRVPEHSLDAVTGLSGSGPAYLFLVVEALIEGGVQAGLSYEVSSALVAQTLVGSGRLLVESGDAPGALRMAVTSPGGTTAAGLRVLEGRAVRAAFLEAVAAAADRSRQLGRS